MSDSSYNQLNDNKRSFKFASLNVCGLKRRAEYPEFIEFVKKYDLVCFSETKIDATDIISFPGFCCYDQPRKQKYSRKSGGISVYFDERLRWRNTVENEHMGYTVYQ